MLKKTEFGDDEIEISNLICKFLGSAVALNEGMQLELDDSFRDFVLKGLQVG